MDPIRRKQSKIYKTGKFINDFHTEMASLTMPTTERDKTLLILNGFIYMTDGSTKRETYWKLEYCRTIKCKVRVHINLSCKLILSKITEHNHPASSLHKGVRLLQDNILSRAIHTTESTQCSLDHFLNNVSDQIITRRPSFKTK
jgi:hypothetical protein